MTLDLDRCSSFLLKIYPTKRNAREINKATMLICTNHTVDWVDVKKTTTDLIQFSFLWASRDGMSFRNSWWIILLQQLMLRSKKDFEKEQKSFKSVKKISFISENFFFFFFFASVWMGKCFVQSLLSLLVFSRTFLRKTPTWEICAEEEVKYNEG